MTKLIFSGTEVGSNRTLLEGQKVESMGLNYWGLRKRGLPKTKLWLISEHFTPETKVYIESGAAQADKAGLSKEELLEIYGKGRGHKRTEESKKLISVALKNQWDNPELREKRRSSMLGKRALVECPHCKLIGGGGNMRRYHFKNCKNANQ
jgi:hypothetical protein